MLLCCFVEQKSGGRFASMCVSVNLGHKGGQRGVMLGAKTGQTIVWTLITIEINWPSCLLLSLVINNALSLNWCWTFFFYAQRFICTSFLLSQKNFEDVETNMHCSIIVSPLIALVYHVYLQLYEHLLVQILGLGIFRKSKILFNFGTSQNRNECGLFYRNKTDLHIFMHIRKAYNDLCK